ncbi:MAG: plasmid replication protein RepC [Sphingomonadaceae bacterium]
MDYTPISPFMRPISRAHLRVIEKPESPVSGKPVNKWEVLRELSKAQAAFGVTERELTVLQGLLSFFPEDALGGNAEMIVFPSNKAICERLNGMPCSTMRRHLARLVETGLLVRRDSPNGKRYVRKHRDERVAFGFDLSPLYCRFEEIGRAAEAVRETEDRVRRLRGIVSLMRRDLVALAEFGEELQPDMGLWSKMRETAAQIARALRRKLPPKELERHQTEIATLLEKGRDIIDGPETERLGANGAHNEQHYHNSQKESFVLEPSLEKDGKTDGTPDLSSNLPEESPEAAERKQAPKIPLRLVVSSCPALKTFYDGEIRHWHQLYDAASHIRPAMGISASAWEEAQRCMGPEQASVVVAAILERFEDIRSPGGYLRALTTRAAEGHFSCGPMVMALLGRKNAA